MANSQNIEREKPFIFYRSRFQPRFTTPHDYAVRRFYELRQESWVGESLVLAIVDEQLFIKLFPQEFKDVIAKGLRSTLGDRLDIYLLRFDKSLNPSDIGEVKHSIWEWWYRRQPHSPRPLQYTITCCTAWCGIALYWMKDGQGTKDSQSMTSAIEYITRWLPEKNPDNIEWYFPIFDRDDINDIGLLASLMAKRSGEVSRHKKQISFTRFNYDSMAGKGLVYDGRYGAYIKILADSDRYFPDRWKGIGGDLRQGLEFPKKNMIHFIYHWCDVILIYQKICNLIRSYIRNKVGLGEYRVHLEGIIDNIEKDIAVIKENKTSYSKALEEFHAFMREIPLCFQKAGVTEERMLKGLNELAQIATAELPGNETWLEGNTEATERFQKVALQIDNLTR